MHSIQRNPFLSWNKAEQEAGETSHSKDLKDLRQALDGTDQAVANKKENGDLGIIFPYSAAYCRRCPYSGVRAS